MHMRIMDILWIIFETLVTRQFYANPNMLRFRYHEPHYMLGIFHVEYVVDCGTVPYLEEPKSLLPHHISQLLMFFFHLQRHLSITAYSTFCGAL